MDFTELLVSQGIWLMISLIVAVCAYFLGRYADIYWRAKRLRSIFKKPYILLNIRNKDGRTITQRIINSEEGEIRVGKYIWVINKGSIYRKDKPENTFTVSEELLKWEEGLPTVFVDYDNIKPLEFADTEQKVSSSQVSSLLTAWVSNEIAKGFGAMKHYFILLVGIAIGVGLLLALTYTMSQSVGQMQAQIDVLHNDTILLKNKLGIMEGYPTENGTIIITQHR